LLTNRRRFSFLRVRVPTPAFIVPFLTFISNAVGKAMSRQSQVLIRRSVAFRRILTFRESVFRRNPPERVEPETICGFVHILSSDFFSRAWRGDWPPPHGLPESFHWRITFQLWLYVSPRGFRARNPALQPVLRSRNQWGTTYSRIWGDQPIAPLPRHSLTLTRP
jgi:hypothetical protein